MDDFEWVTNTNPEYGDNVFLSMILVGMREHTTYFVETSEADRIGYHSVMGLFDHSQYYTQGISDISGQEWFGFGKMGYWPIGTLKEAESYAAQPVSCAAVVDGGSTELAAKVIKALTELKTGSEFGFSVNRQAREEQLTNWNQRNGLYLHREVNNANEWRTVKEATRQGYWSTGVIESPQVMVNRATWSDQVREQLDHVVVCQIPDRELMTIWQDTVTEAVDTGLTAEAGFGLLCERMDEWYKRS